MSVCEKKLWPHKFYKVVCVVTIVHLIIIIALQTDMLKNRRRWRACIYLASEMAPFSTTTPWFCCLYLFFVTRVFRFLVYNVVYNILSFFMLWKKCSLNSLHIFFFFPFCFWHFSGFRHFFFYYNGFSEFVWAS